MRKGKRTKSNDLLPEYDFSSMKGGVRGYGGPRAEVDTSGWVKWGTEIG